MARFAGAGWEQATRRAAHQETHKNHASEGVSEIKPSATGEEKPATRKQPVPTTKFPHLVSR